MRIQHFRLLLGGCVLLYAARLLLAATTLPVHGAAFPLKPASNGRYLVDQEGRPFFFHADTCWQIAKKLTREEIDFYLDRRKADGFTALMAHTFSKERTPMANRDGHNPFNPPDDITRPNEPYWQHVDYFLQAAEKRGFAVALAPLWVRWGGNDTAGWRYALNEDNAAVYGSFLAQRYTKLKNIIWILGGDANPIELTRPIALLAQAIKKAAPHHLITVHNKPGYASAAFFDTQDWLDINLAYTYEDVFRHVMGEWNRFTPRPIILGESGYEQESNDGRGGPPVRVRRQAYESVLAGALAGHAYGHRDIWWLGPNWKKALDDPGSRHMIHVRNLFTSLAWWKLQPDQHHRLMPANRDFYDKSQYLTAARAPDGSLAVAYFPAQRAAAVQLDQLAGDVKAYWFDPTDGTRKDAIDEPLPPRGTHMFEPPGKNAAGDPDWVLVLHARTP